MGGRKAMLVLEDGRTFDGIAIGAGATVFGEVVFNTSMTGYQEICTDPSYAGQIVTFTAPHVGNYGVCEADAQANRVWAAGIVVRELSFENQTWRSNGAIGQWMADNQLSGIAGVDTRALTKHIRDRGAMRAGIFQFTNLDAAIGVQDVLNDALKQVRATPSMEGQNLAQRVATNKPYTVAAAQNMTTRQRVVVVDYGVKRGILNQLARRGLDLEVVPLTMSAKDILAKKPDGVVLSNGPGDPAAVTEGIAVIRDLIGKVPILGICLGYQLLGLALGGKSFKLPFGHRGGNHPVKDLQTGQVWITAQNHGFAIDPDSLRARDAILTHTSLYDGTLEGFAVPQQQIIAVQFHPEGSPGPTDAEPVFDRFISMIKGTPSAEKR